jgi:hypothetical protein
MITLSSTLSDVRHSSASSSANSKPRQAFDRTEGWRHQRLVDLAKQLDQHWAAFPAAARTGDPFGYGKQHFNKPIAPCSTAANFTSDEVAHGKLAELERAIVTSPRPKTDLARRAGRQQVAVGQPRIWPGSSHYLQQQGRVPERGIGL